MIDIWCLECIFLDYLELINDFIANLIFLMVPYFLLINLGKKVQSIHVANKICKISNLRWHTLNTISGVHSSVSFETRTFSTKTTGVRWPCTLFTQGAGLVQSKVSYPKQYMGNLVQYIVTNETILKFIIFKARRDQKIKKDFILCVYFVAMNFRNKSIV